MSARDNHIKGVHGDMRQILPLHRSTLVDYDLDRKRAADAAADAPDLYAELPPKAERTEAANIWRVAFWFGFTVAAFLLLVHWGVSK